MRVIIAGGGAVGLQLVRALEDSDNEVVVVEERRDRVAELQKAGVKVVCGNACVAETLESAGALRCDVLVACTENDEENLVVAVVAKRHLDVPRVVARVNDDANRWLFDESWGVDAAVSASSALVSLIEEATGSAHAVRLADLTTVGLVLTEFNVTAESHARGRNVAELSLPLDLVAAVVRRDVPVQVDASLRFEVGDRVVMLTDAAGEAAAQEAFYPGSTA